MRIPIRHGEVLLLPVDSTPAGSSERVTSCVVGDSGQDPVLDGDREFARIVDAKGTLFVDLDEPTRMWYRKDRDQRLEHELEIAAGAWRVVPKRAPEVRAS